MKKASDINKLTDEQLIEYYQSNYDTNALGVLYKRHTRFVYYVSMKYLKDPERSEDMVMQVFEKLFKELKSQNLIKFQAWLHTVTRNECLMLLRSEQSQLKKQQEFKKDEESDMEISDELHLTEKKILDKRLDMLQEAVKSLKPEQKQCVELFYIQEKSYVEISEHTGFDIKQVKSFIQNGKRNLRIFLDRSGVPVIILISIFGDKLY